MRALRIAATGMAAQQLNVETVSNNIANMNTVGYKRQRAEFQDLLYQNIERMGALVKGNALVKERLEAITRWTEDVESFLSLDAEHTAWLKKHGLVAADPSNVQAQEPK